MSAPPLPGFQEEVALPNDLTCVIPGLNPGNPSAELSVVSISLDHMRASLSPTDGRWRMPSGLVSHQVWSGVSATTYFLSVVCLL